MEYIEIIKERLLLTYQTESYSKFIEETETLYMDKNYNIGAIFTDVTDFQKYILN